MTPTDLLNRVLNHPDVLPGLAPGQSNIDTFMFWREPRNLIFGDEDGLVLFFWKGNGAYSFHFCFTKAVRGRAALQMSRDAITQVFTNHAATLIVGTVPRTNRASRAMARALGARPVGTSTDSQGRACINYVIERDTWAIFSAPYSEQTKAKPPDKPLPKRT